MKKIACWSLDCFIHSNNEKIIRNAQKEGKLHQQAQVPCTFKQQYLVTVSLSNADVVYKGQRIDRTTIITYDLESVTEEANYSSSSLFFISVVHSYSVQEEKWLLKHICTCMKTLKFKGRKTGLNYYILLEQLYDVYISYWNNKPVIKKCLLFSIQRSVKF